MGQSNQYVYNDIFIKKGSGRKKNQYECVAFNYSIRGDTTCIQAHVDSILQAVAHDIYRSEHGGEVVQSCVFRQYLTKS